MYRHVVRVLFLLWLGGYGCIPEPVEPAEDGGRPGDVGQSVRGFLEEHEPNDDFAQALLGDLSQTPDFLQIVGTIESEADHDVYSLGPLDSGARVVTTLESFANGEVTVCFFDHDQSLLARSTVIAPNNPRLFEFVPREPIDNLQLVAFASSQTTRNQYSVKLAVQQYDVVSSYNPQVIVLNFEGAQDVYVAGRYYPSISPFDPADIDIRFSDRGMEMVESILQRVQQDYAGLDIQIYLSSDPEVPAVPHSIVHFGSSNPELLGVADGVDPFNSYISQSAIIYTDTFSLFSSLEPDEDMMVQLLANVTSHEIGHLLGLRHTDDQDDLMDVTATARRLMFDQWFKKARLHATVCPLGYQDAPVMLSWTLGGQLFSPPPKAERRMATGVGGPDDFRVPRHWLSSHCCEQQ